MQRRYSFLLVVRQVAPIAYKHRRKELFCEEGGPGSKFGSRTPYQNGFVFHLNPINFESTRSMLQLLYFRPKLNVYFRAKDSYHEKNLRKVLLPSLEKLSLEVRKTPYFYNLG